MFDFAEQTKTIRRFLQLRRTEGGYTMTDEQIIKALECCKSPIPMCDDCPVGESDMCFDFLKGYALDLIKRQQEEIEKLQGNLKFVRGTVARLLEKSDKQQAWKWDYIAHCTKSTPQRRK